MNFDIKIISTKSQIEEFKKSFIWKDIRRELAIWIKGLKIEESNIVEEASSSNLTSASILLHIGDINGRRKAVRFLLDLPDMFLNSLEAQNDPKCE